VKPVTVAILKTVVVDVVCVKTILPEPNATARVFELFELNIPVDRLKPARSNVPEVNVIVLVAVKANAAPNVVVPVVLLIVIKANVVLPFDVIVPVPTIVGVKLVNVPPLDKVNPFKFNAVVPGLNAVVPKSSLLNQLAVVKVITDVPESVSVKFGAIAEVPPVVPKTTVLVTAAVVVKPPVPVQVNPVAVANDSTVCAAVGCTNTMLLAPNAIDLVAVPEDANIPVVRSNPFNDKAPLVMVTVAVLTVVNALPKDQAPATPLKLIVAALNEVPLVVIVLPVVVELNVIPPVLLHTVPATNDMLPETANVGVVPVANVTTPADTVISKHNNAPVIVTV
jgi:hypothetical protein